MYKVMGDAYVSDFRTNYLMAFWMYQRRCLYVEAADRGAGVGSTYFFAKEGRSDVERVSRSR
jgi:hypothetical protein